MYFVPFHHCYLAFSQILGGFTGAFILVDLRNNGSAKENHIQSSQLLNEPAYRLRGSVKQLATWRQLDCLHVLHSTRGFTLCFVRVPAVTRLYFVWFLSLLHWRLKKKKVSEWLEVTRKITYKTGEWITAWAELPGFLFHFSTDLLMSHTKKLKRVLIGHDAWRASLSFSRHLWGLRCLITGTIWLHARMGGEWELH